MEKTLTLEELQKSRTHSKNSLIEDIFQIGKTHHTNLSQKAYDYVMPLLEKKCKQYQFHNIHHTDSVFERATYLGMSEGVGGDDLEDLQIAAIFHDTGFTVQYPKNEFAGSQIARKWLEKEQHPEERIQKIEAIIMATTLFSTPKNILEEIIQDADMDNIGTKLGFANSQELIKEVREFGRANVSDCAFWQFTYKIYFHFKFHTKTAQSERNNQKNLNLKLVEAYCHALWCEIPAANDHLEKIV